MRPHPVGKRRSDLVPIMAKVMNMLRRGETVPASLFAQMELEQYQVRAMIEASGTDWTEAELINKPLLLPPPGGEMEQRAAELAPSPHLSAKPKCDQTEERRAETAAAEEMFEAFGALSTTVHENLPVDMAAGASMGTGGLPPPSPAQQQQQGQLHGGQQGQPQGGTAAAAAAAAARPPAPAAPAAGHAQPPAAAGYPLRHPLCCGPFRHPLGARRHERQFWLQGGDQLCANQLMAEEEENGPGQGGEGGVAGVVGAINASVSIPATSTRKDRAPARNRTPPPSAASAKSQMGWGARAFQAKTHPARKVDRPGPRWAGGHVTRVATGLGS